MMRLLGCEFMEPKGRDELEAGAGKLAEFWLFSSLYTVCAAFLI